MTPSGQWPRVKEIVGAALEYEPSRRKTFLDSACVDDEQLRAEVDSLIAAYEQSADLSAGGWAAALPEEVETPTNIGPYRLERELGLGGMGQVWLAEQLEPVHRYVALKLIRADFRDREVAQRFMAERQSLALMNHSSIAKVFDAGTTPAGQPYLVMEYVDGCPITEYCDRNKLPIAERLRLFQLVCEGVQHAHQKAIIHRDLKPSNILVTEVDGKPTPRIIDFGIAKAVSAGMDAQTLFTRIGSVVGTLGYMSPEQAEGGTEAGKEDIDTRSDVYSLGVVLYELLTGALPLDQRKLNYFEALRQLREQDAPRPSTRLRESSDSLVIAANRAAEPVTLARSLRGDADAIALKAIEKDRNRRYATPAELAADIERYLRHEPVSAHAAGFSYLARKYVRRHRVGVILAAAGVLLLVGFAVAQAIQLRNVRRQRDRADRISHFMEGIFKVSNPNQAQGKTITARDLLDKGAAQITAELKDDPELEARMMYQMAGSYYGLGVFAQAHALASTALSIQQRVLGPRNLDSLKTMSLIGSLMLDEGHLQEAEKQQRETLKLDQDTLGEKDIETLRQGFWLGTTLNAEGKFSEAERLFRQTIRTEQEAIGASPQDRAMAMDGLAYSLEREGRLDEAEKQYRETIAFDRQIFGPEQPNTSNVMSNLANTLLEEQRFPEAERQYQETLAIQRRILGAEHPDTLNTEGNLAVAMEYEGRATEAEVIQRRVLAVQQRVLGADHPYTLLTEGYIGIDLADKGHFEDSRELFRALIIKAARNDQPGELANAWYNFACAAAISGHNEDALEDLNKAVDHGLPSAQLANEPHLDFLHGDPRYEALVARAKAANP